MNIQASVLSSQTAPSLYTNNAIITLTISYIIPSISPNGTITITAPPTIDISSSNSCIVTDNNAGTNSTCSIISPRIQATFVNTNNALSHSYTVVIGNVRNAPSFKSID